MRLSCTIKTEADRQHFIRLASRYELEAGKEYTGELGITKKVRTNRQNDYYHDWLRFIAFSGFIDDDIDMLHEYFRGLYVQGKQICGETVRKSTTKLTTTEFIKYMDDIQAHMLSRYKFWLPPPETPEYSEMKKAMGRS